MKNKITTLQSEFEGSFKERHDEIAGALLGVLSGEHLLFLGPPGTAKSLLANKICDAVEGGNLFYYLLTRFTTPEEIFGPLSLKALEQDQYRRKTEGYLPESHIAFLDEIFKANSSILNSLLTLLNERKFHNGQDVIDVPLLSVFGASNELPEEEEGLEALYDRFLIRYVVGNVQDETNFRELVLSDVEGFQPSVKLKLSEIEGIQKKSKKVKVDEDVQNILVELRRLLASKKIQVSDRRWKKMLKILKVASAATGRKSVDRTMALLIQHMAWDKPEQRESIRNLVIDLTISGGVSLDKLKKDIDDLHELTEESQDYQFPESIECYTCEQKFRKKSTLEKHAKRNPDHEYTDPSKSDSFGYSGSTIPYEDLMDELTKDKRWSAKASVSDQHKKLYTKELGELRGKFKGAKHKLETERDQLKRLLNTNIWIGDKDRNEVLYKHENKLKLTHQIEKNLDSIEGILSGTGKSSSKTRRSKGKASDDAEVDKGVSRIW